MQKRHNCGHAIFLFLKVGVTSRKKYTIVGKETFKVKNGSPNYLPGFTIASCRRVSTALIPHVTSLNEAKL